VTRRGDLTVVSDLAFSVNGSDFTVAEFFAGVGLARVALENAGFSVVWANDYSAKKFAMYAGHFRDSAGSHTFELGDIGEVSGDQLPTGLAMAWASFPCTDLSLAGNGNGINEGESKTFWDFTKIIGEMGERAPGVVCLENVPGLATTNGGDDLRAAVRAMNDLGYSVDVLSLDARRFVPQSRERLFLVCVKSPLIEADTRRVSALRPESVQFVHREDGLRTHAALLPDPPPYLTTGLVDVIENMPDDDDRWWSEDRTVAALDSLSDVQAKRIALLKQRKRAAYRTGYRRTRKGVAVWEFREDDVSGCLRTARGGSSKQAVIKVCDGRVMMRWMTPLEYARLMGAGDYTLGTVSAPQSIFGFGDAVCVPVVQWIAENYLMPIVTGTGRSFEAEEVARG